MQVSSHILRKYLHFKTLQYILNLETEVPRRVSGGRREGQPPLSPCIRNIPTYTIA